MMDTIAYESLFQAYCDENRLSIKLSFDMPEGYETANGTFDPVVNTLFINREMLRSRPGYEQGFYLFHELRHALQYLQPRQFNDLICRSRFYVIMYDGTCCKLADDGWKECRLEGSEAYFSELYLGQPYERDANDFAYQKTKEHFGDSEGLRRLHAFWTPKNEIPAQAYEDLYAMIDSAVG